MLRKLGQGSFGSVYKCRTTSRAAEGRNIKCVVKRVTVDFDKDINEASEALQVCMYVCMNVCMYVYTYVFMHVRTRDR